MAAKVTGAVGGLTGGFRFSLARFAPPRHPEGRAVCWHLATRYIAQALILASYSVECFGPIPIASLVQVSAAGLVPARMVRA